MGLRPRFTTSHAITAALTHIERARGFLRAAKLSEEWLRRMGERALLLEAHHTTHIEGTHLTLEQAERLLAGESVPEADPEDARELLNSERQALALDHVLEHGKLSLQDFVALQPEANRRTLQRDLRALALE
jgi:Fic family protein